MDCSLSCIDKKGAPFEIREYRGGDYDRLVEMYDCFSPKGRFQGMPPVDRDACLEWTSGLVATGENLLALRGNRVMGHVVMIPDPEARDAEYLIFVIQAERNCGVGTKLSKVAVEKARLLGLKRLWLTVGTYNYPAIGLYTKLGFLFCQDDRLETERMMALEL